MCCVEVPRAWRVQFPASNLPSVANFARKKLNISQYKIVIFFIGTLN